MISFPEAIRRGFKLSFTGRASRAEYWYFVLFSSLCALGGFIALAFLSGIVEAATSSGEMTPSTRLVLWVIGGIGYLGLALLNIGVLVRRLHDMGAPGWLALLVFVPYLGGIALTILACQSTQPYVNQYGPPPPWGLPPIPPYGPSAYWPYPPRQIPTLQPQAQYAPVHPAESFPPAPEAGTDSPRDTA